MDKLMKRKADEAVAMKEKEKEMYKKGIEILEKQASLQGAAALKRKADNEDVEARMSKF